MFITWNDAKELKPFVKNETPWMFPTSNIVYVKNKHNKILLGMWQLRKVPPDLNKCSGYEEGEDIPSHNIWLIMNRLGDANFLLYEESEITHWRYIYDTNVTNNLINNAVE